MLNSLVLDKMKFQNDEDTSGLLSVVFQAPAQNIVFSNRLTKLSLRGLVINERNGVSISKALENSQITTLVSLDLSENPRWRNTRIYATELVKFIQR